MHNVLDLNQAGGLALGIVDADGESLGEDEAKDLVGHEAKDLVMVRTRALCARSDKSNWVPEVALQGL